MDINKYWNVCLKQDAESLKQFFHQEAYINWHNTNEQFTVEEFITANCEYPGKWDGSVERVVNSENLIITVVHVHSINFEQSFHVTSFIIVRDDKIVSIDEYWGDDGEVPKWRQEKKIGNPIK